MAHTSVRHGSLLLVLVACLGMTGCAAALVGAGAVIGYAVSRDRVDLTVERPYPAVWSTCLEEAKRFGLLKEADQAAGRIEVLNQGTHVTLTLERLSETTVKIIFKARKNLLPKIDVAQRLATQLARKLS